MTEASRLAMPSPPMILSEDEVERRVERMTDNIDRRFMRGLLSKDAYEKEIADLARWADAKRGRR